METRPKYRTRLIQQTELHKHTPMTILPFVPGLLQGMYALSHYHSNRCNSVKTHILPDTRAGTHTLPWWLPWWYYSSLDREKMRTLGNAHCWADLGFNSSLDRSFKCNHLTDSWIGYICNLNTNKFTDMKGTFYLIVLSEWWINS